MKISKVEHTKAAVGNNIENSNIKGFLYKNPSNGQPIDLKKQIQDCDKKGKFLYNLFVPVQAGVAPKEPNGNVSEIKKANYEIKKANYEKRLKCAKKINGVNKVLKRNILFDKQLFNKNEKILNNMKDRNNDIHVDDELASCIVELALRSSLKKYPEYRKAAIILLTKAGKPGISEHEKETLTGFLDFIRSDYNRMNTKDPASDGARTIRSIENQNMVIQPNEGILSLSVPSNNNKNTNHKYSEKKGFDEFIKSYANLNENDRNNMLRKIRRIVDLYFASPNVIDDETDYSIPESVDVSENFDVFKIHERNKNNKNSFVEVPDILIDSKTNNKRIDLIKQKEAVAELKDAIRRRNINCYRFAKAVIEKNNSSNCFFESMDTNLFWIHHIENAVERILKKLSVGNCDYRLSQGYLSEKVWKDALNTISVKYIAIGKAVYQFAMDDLYKSGDITLGNISDSVVSGINSFDYEMIKAKETLQRELAVYVAYAANNLARATIDMSKVSANESDILTWKVDDLSKKLDGKTKNETIRSILQFFGGMSNWDIELIKKAYSKNSKYNYEVLFLNDIKDIIFAMRNESFHFTTASVDKGSWNKDLIAGMFRADASRSVSIQKDALYTNNLPRYYKVTDLEKLINIIYSNNGARGAQVPAFGNLVVRKTFPIYLSEKLGIGMEKKYDDKELDKWQSALYYLVKEIYYNSYLQSNRAKALFLEACYGLTEVPDVDKSRQATDDFKKRIQELSKLSLPQICQNIMTEYNLQNGNRKVRSSKDSLFDKELYKHYKILLHQALANALACYIRSEEEFKFLFNPFTGGAIRSELSAQEFLPNWTSTKYKELMNRVGENAYLQKWYITTKFINPKMLNLLAGSLRSYVQYAQDIRKRARNTQNKLHINVDNIEDINQVICIIDMCITLAGNVSSEFTDYFSTLNDYAYFVANFIRYTNSPENASFEEFKRFCKEGDYDIYMDAKNPRPNRNIILSKLYSPVSALKEIEPVTKKDIDEFYSLKDKILPYKNKGICNSEEEQKNVIEYQRTKNLVELRNIAEYGEIINNLLGQLVNWSFIRERDLLYYQLGFHYLCLKNDTYKPDEYVTITDDKNNYKVDGAILHQVAGMYINGVSVYSTDEKSNKQDLIECAEIGSVGKKIGAFIRYTKKILDNTPLCNQGDTSVYNAGLEIFENINEHDNITDIRNYIDHFRYFVNDEKTKQFSILDLYSEVFDRFFTYDMKYQKNVMNMLFNMLLKNMIIIEPSLVSGAEKEVGEGKKRYTKSRAQIGINSIEAERFTYKIQKGKEKYILNTASKSKRVIRDVLSILYYPQSVPENEIKINESADKVTKIDNTKSYNSANKPQNKNSGNRSNKGGYNSKSIKKK